MRLKHTEFESKRVASETETQKLILQYLRAIGVFCFRINTGGVRREGKWCPSPTVTKGTSDIIAIKNYYYGDSGSVGQFVAIEVKKVGAKQSPEQKQFQKDVESKKGLYILAYSVNDIRAHFGR